MYGHVHGVIRACARHYTVITVIKRPDSTLYTVMHRYAPLMTPCCTVNDTVCVSVRQCVYVSVRQCERPESINMRYRNPLWQAVITFHTVYVFSCFMKRCNIPHSFYQFY